LARGCLVNTCVLATVSRWPYQKLLYCAANASCTLIFALLSRLPRRGTISGRSAFPLWRMWCCPTFSSTLTLHFLIPQYNLTLPFLLCCWSVGLRHHLFGGAARAFGVTRRCPFNLSVACSLDLSRDLRIGISLISLPARGAARSSRQRVNSPSATTAPWPLSFAPRLPTRATFTDAVRPADACRWLTSLFLSPTYHITTLTRWAVAGWRHRRGWQRRG